MSAPSDPDPRIRRALTRGLPDRAPEGLLDAVRQRTADVPQRRAPGFTRLLGRPAVRIALASTIALAALGIGIARFAQPGGSAAPSATSVSSLPPRPQVPADGTCEDEAECLGILPPGTASSHVFQPTVMFTVPDGWMSRDDRGGIFDLRPIEAPGDGIFLYRDPVPVKGDRLVSGVEESARSLATALRSDPEVLVGTLQPVTLGGLKGWSIDVGPAREALRSSPDCPRATCVTIFTATDPAPRPVWMYRLALTAGSRARIYLLDAPQGVVLVTAIAWNGTTFEERVALWRPILESLRFAPR